MYYTMGASPSKMLKNTFKVFKTLMSLFEPKVPKKACKIHRSVDVTALTMIVYFPSSPQQNLLFLATGQTFHSQCIQLREPNISKKPCASPICRIRLVTS